jgi:purine-binding chemotaxis protein CheW
MSRATDASEAETGPDATEEVLEFGLGTETYCVSISHVTEIVETGERTSIPNAPPHVEGVMDLRGETTSIVDPKVVLGVDGEQGDRIIVFDTALFDGDRSVGWAVDDVKEVATIETEAVDEAPVEDDHVRGLIKRDEEFVVWVDPEAMESSL